MSKIVEFLHNQNSLNTNNLPLYGFNFIAIIVLSKILKQIENRATIVRQGLWKVSGPQTILPHLKTHVNKITHV